VGVVGAGILIPSRQQSNDNETDSKITDAYQQLKQQYLVNENDSKQSIRLQYEGIFTIHCMTIDFHCGGALNSYPVASPFTSARHPETAIKIGEEVEKMKAWLTLRLRVTIPPVFGVVFDPDAIGVYERFFSMLMKIRVVTHTLERLWITRSRLSSSRAFNFLRHSMHFFATNLLFYLQVHQLI
jgi:hypothetical protein